MQNFRRFHRMFLKLCFFEIFGWVAGLRDCTLFILSKDKVYKDIEAEIWPKIKDILRTKPSLRFEKKNLFII